MKTKIIMIATLGLVSALLMSVSASAEDAVKEQDQIQTRDQLQVKEQLRQTEEQLRQAKEQLRLKDGEGSGQGEKKKVMEQTRTREMAGASKTRGAAVREATENTGGQKAVKNARKAGPGERKLRQERKHERKQERKQLHRKERVSSPSSGTRGFRAGNSGSADFRGGKRR